ncbi:hypothetical protein T07_4992 [Trichinella nelsoni]|uniref:Uncharacterized protein n=1 Tax=Trichinella nelsoni TaxID=6336 RepID=A0A0V0S1E1_9BILA|nr:hypothetical protein T07_4992 [Trichinella nelsoni]
MIKQCYRVGKKRKNQMEIDVHKLDFEANRKFSRLNSIVVAVHISRKEKSPPQWLTNHKASD